MCSMIVRKKEKKDHIGPHVRGSEVYKVRFYYHSR